MRCLIYLYSYLFEQYCAVYTSRPRGIVEKKKTGGGEVKYFSGLDFFQRNDAIFAGMMRWCTLQHRASGSLQHEAISCYLTDKPLCVTLCRQTPLHGLIFFTALPYQLLEVISAWATLFV